MFGNELKRDIKTTKGVKKASVILSVLFFLFFAQELSAQKKIVISGFVRDSLTAEPLVGVVVADARMYGTVTNDYGFFSVTVSEGTTELFFTHLGYKDKIYEVRTDSNTEQDIRLVPSSIEIEAVEVEAKKERYVTTGKGGSMTVNSEMLKYIPSFMGEKDIFKYLQMMPGVQPGKEGSSGLNIRGGSADQTLILLDDVPIYNSAHAFGFVSIFSGDYIRSAKLYKGYVPPEYGGRLSGVATMTIREGNRNRHTGSVQVGTTTLSALAEGPIAKGRGSYLVGGRYFLPDLFLRAASAFMSKKNSSYTTVGFYDITAKAGYDISNKTSLHAGIYTGRDAINYITHDMVSSQDNGEMVSHYRSGLSWGNVAASLRLRSEINDKCFFDMTAYYSLLKNRNASDYDDSEGMVFGSETTSRMDEAGMKAVFSHNAARFLRLDYGISASYQYFQPYKIGMNRNGAHSSTLFGNRGLVSTSLFANGEFRLSTRFGLDIGGRLSLYSDKEKQLFVAEPRAVFNFYTRKGEAWIGYTENTQPLFSMNKQLASFPVDYWIPYQNVDELPRSRQLSIGGKHSFDFGLKLQAEAYLKRSRNIAVVYNGDDFLMNDGGYMLASGNSYGFELLAQYGIGRFETVASYAWSPSDYHMNGRKVDFMYEVPHNLNIFASYETLRKGERRHTLSVNLNYHSGMPYIITNTKYPSAAPLPDMSGDVIDYPAYPNARMTDFFRLDLNYVMEKKLKRGSRIWQVSVLNATAHKNPYIVYYYPRSDKFKATTLIPIMPSFSYTRKF